MVLHLLLFIGAYLSGSISSAVLLSKLVNAPDPRQYGSKNPGATNILRGGSRTLALSVLLVDIFKGVLPVFVAKWVGVSIEGLAFVAFFAFLGHVFSIFLKFRGGKGVATALGGILVVCWPLGLLLVVSWAFILIIFRYVSLASVIAALICIGGVFLWLPPRACFPIILITIFLIGRHKENIKRLLHGEEKKIGGKS